MDDVNKVVFILEDLIKELERRRRNTYAGGNYTEIIDRLEQAVTLLVGIKNNRKDDLFMKKERAFLIKVNGKERIAGKVIM